MRNEELSKGTWLVVVEEGHTSATQIEPDFPELDAALYHVKEGMLKAMHEKSKMRPSSIPWSKKEIKAWDAYQKIMGKDMPTYFQFPSLHDIAKAGCEVIREKAKKEKKKYRNKPNKKVNPIMDLEI